MAQKQKLISLQFFIAIRLAARIARDAFGLRSSTVRSRCVPGVFRFDLDPENAGSGA